jgi:hypothetical protein
MTEVETVFGGRLQYGPEPATPGCRRGRRGATARLPEFTNTSEIEEFNLGMYYICTARKPYCARRKMLTYATFENESLTRG